MIVLYYRLLLNICINNVSVQIIGGGLDARICFDGGYMGASGINNRLNIEIFCMDYAENFSI